VRAPLHSTGAGLIKSGRHIKYPDEAQRLTNLQLTLLNRLKVPTETFGDSTGEQLRELSDLQSSGPQVCP